MLSYEFYKFLHYVGMFSLFFVFGAFAVVNLLGGGERRHQKYAAIAHGISLIVVLVGGFGMLARLGTQWPFPSWVLAKIVVWIILGGLLTLLKKNLIRGPVIYPLVVFLGVLAAYFALVKPF